MSRVGIAILFTWASLATVWAQGARTAAMRVHGNYMVSDEEVVRLSGFEAGAALTSETARDIEQRLLQSDRFDEVEVRVRYRSLDTTSDAVLVVVVRERTSLAKRWMLGPVFDMSDEYGFTYGAQLALVDLPFEHARVRFPVSWGGNRSVGIGTTVPITLNPDGWNHQFEAGLRRQRTIHPHFDLPDQRTELEASLFSRRKALKLGLTSRRSRVDFDVLDESFFELGGHASVDTRSDRTIPGDAFYLALDWGRLFFRDGIDERVDTNRANRANRVRIDARGYKRLVGQSTLAAQISYTRASGPLPNYAKSLLGGGRTLRGHDAGRFVGDRMALATLELRIPLTSTLVFQRAGIHFFYDTGSAFDYPLGLRKAQFHHGVGFGGFFRVAFVGARVDLGFDLEGNARFHFGSQFKF